MSSSVQTANGTRPFTAARLLAFIRSEAPGSFAVIAALSAVAFFWYARRFPEPPYFGGDAEHYWKLGATFFSGGSFSLLGSEQTFRGYLLPLIFGSVQQVGALTGLNPFTVFYLVNAVLTAVSLAIVIPLLAVKLFDVRVQMWQVAAFIALFVVFWRGYLVEPLSDSWSLFLVLASLLALVHAAERRPAGAAALGFLAGLCLAAAINLRPIYLACLPLYLIGALLLMYRRLFTLAAILIPMGAAFLLVLAPQSMLNLKYLGTANPFTHSGSLYTLQLFFGLAVQRHECAYYIDPAGVELLKVSGINVLAEQGDGRSLFALDISQRDTSQYLSIVLKHPIDAAGIYARHVVNGMALLGSNIYHCMPGQPRSLFNVGSLAVVLLGAAAALLFGPRLRNARYHALAWIPLIPVALTIPTAMEGRFFLAVHLWAYALLCFVSPWVAWRPALASHARTVLPAMGVVFLFAVSQLSLTFASTYAWQGANKDGVLLKPYTILLNN